MYICRVVAASYHGAVGQEREGRNADQDNLALLAVAKQFRDAASSAGRPDVVAKIDEAILLLAGTGSSAGKPHDSDDKTTVVLRILDGLGF
jgi:hypothetical protein